MSPRAGWVRDSLALALAAGAANFSNALLAAPAALDSARLAGGVALFGVLAAAPLAVLPAVACTAIRQRSGEDHRAAAYLGFVLGLAWLGFPLRPVGAAGALAGPSWAVIGIGLTVFVVARSRRSAPGSPRHSRSQRLGRVTLRMGIVLTLAAAWEVLRHRIQLPAADAELSLRSLGALAPAAALAAAATPFGRRLPYRTSYLMAVPIAAVASAAYVWLQAYRIDGVVSVENVLALLALAIVATTAWYARGGTRDTGAGRAARVVLVLAATLTAAMLLRPSAGRDTKALRERGAPSIILVTIDTLRADSIGSAEIATPNLDRLRQDSLDFEAARSVSSWTKTSMISMFTGVSPAAHMALGIASEMPSGLQSFPEVLSAAGYKTTAVVTNTFLRSKFGFSRGFRDFTHFPLASAGQALGARVADLAGFHRPGDRTTGQLVGEALARIRRDAAEPFFLWLHIFDPHVPYEPPAGFVSTAAPVGSRVADMFDAPQAIREGVFIPTLEERNRIEALYRWEVEYVDASLGLLLDGLDELELYDDSLLIVTSDHGEEFWEHGAFEHGHSMYDDVLRVPLLVKSPRGDAARRATLAVTTDAVAPTILDYAGLLSNNLRMTAQSLRQPSVEDSAQVFVDTIYGDPLTAIVFEGHKLVRNGRTGAVAWYDLVADPAEAHPLGVGPGRQRLIEALEDKLASYELLRSQWGVEVGSVELDPEAAARLRALGYVQ